MTGLFLPLTLLCVTSTLFAVNLANQQAEPSSLKGKKNFNIWAVLVAGSNGWTNYRHQADVCHAYHVLLNHGVPPSNIIVMMYDDIARNHLNPSPGVVVNLPGGKDVYNNVSKDYTHHQVNKRNFIKVLKGDQDLESRGKKILKSGPKDHVFIYFADHGASGLICFPNDALTSSELMETLHWMHRNKRYGKMTLYIEACESGSMFDDLLPENISIFATTAADSDESSYAIYFDEQRQTYLADEYSINWLVDSDTEKSLANETLERQFQIVKRKTKQSHPQQFGDRSLRHLAVGQFLGGKRGTERLFTIVPEVTDAVSSRLVPLEILRKRISKSVDPVERAALEVELEKIVNGRKYLQSSVQKIVHELCTKGYCASAQHIFKSRIPLRNHEAYGQLALEFHDHCFNLGQHYYALELMYVFINIIEELPTANNNVTNSMDKMKGHLKNACQKHVQNHNYQAIV